MHRSFLSRARQFGGLRFKSSMAAISDINQVENHLKELGVENQLPFARAKIGSFFQQQPALGNQFIEDVTLQNYLKRFMPDSVYTEISQDLIRFGSRCGGELYDQGQECERNPPSLVQYNAWGKRVDEIITGPAWKSMKAVAAEEGLIAIAYERKQAEWSRLYQIVKLYLFSPSSGLYSCPLAMTDGAAKSIEALGLKSLAGSYAHLISRAPEQFWTSGQWMTERRGGSDVARGTETVAVPQTDGSYKLYGYKWFTSATDADMTLTLARTMDQQGNIVEGTKGLAMFYLKVRNDDGSLNNIEIQRLKDKLGTRQLPTAELLLDGATAEMVSEDGKGVASISHMLQITRLHNTFSAASGMRRIINLARDYSHKRDCFGKTIKDQTLHLKTLANMEVEARSALLLSLDMARMLGAQECGVDTAREREVLRLLSPVAKLYTAKQAVAVASEGLECFGGAGYLEDTGLPALLRDAQVLPIWEGTTTVLSLDVLRAVAKSQGECLQALHGEVTSRLSPVASPSLKQSAARLKHAAGEIGAFAANNTGKLEVSARDLAFSIGRVYMGMLLVEHASWPKSTPADVLVANRWCQQDLLPMLTCNDHGNYEDDTLQQEKMLVFEGYKGPHSKL